MEPTAHAQLALAAAPPPITVGSLIGRAFSVWKANFLAFTGAALALNLPVLVALVLLGASGPGAAPIGEGIIRIASMVIGLAQTGALTYGVIQTLAGRPVGFGEMVRAGFSRMGRILLVSFGTGLATMVGFILLVIPGFIAMTAFWVAVPVAVAEPNSESEFLRSRELTKGHRLTLFLVLAVLWVAVFAVAAAAGLVSTLVAGVGGAGNARDVLLPEVAGVVAGAILSVAPAVAYHDLRVAKEGVSTEHLAAVFE